MLCGVQEFDSTKESEISIINRLAAERQDNVMWREFRTRLLRNMGLVREWDQQSGCYVVNGLFSVCFNA